MRKPGLVIVGVVIAVAGFVFSLQGFGVLKGSAMSDSAFWAVAGPVVVVAGLLLAWVGLRGRLR